MVNVPSNVFLQSKTWADALDTWAETPHVPAIM